ncbi:hypothetical protein ACGF12_32310 [Kitasatospora sp. NPDC048296]|uniref:hypothetical protein n=1 Tax=Kitasatospora sp. NPDC048296 TaxID=3364048 RepID=UPI003712CB62
MIDRTPGRRAADCLPATALLNAGRAAGAWRGLLRAPGGPVPVVEDGEDLRFAVVAALRGGGPAVDVTSGRPAAGGMLFVTEDGCVVFDRMLPSDDSTGSVQGMRCEGRTAPQLFLTARDTAADPMEDFAAVDDHRDPPRIHTVRGVGYRLEGAGPSAPGHVDEERG